MSSRLLFGVLAYSLGSFALMAASPDDPPTPAPRPIVAGHRGSLFVTSENCLACHNGLSTPSGEDVSIGTSWRATMMANSARDPYWQASVRRETLDHAESAAKIEHECSVCHMPMSHTTAVARGQQAQVFAHLPTDRHRGEADLLAADGVSCAMCHQIGPERLGTAESFTGGYVIDFDTPFEKRAVFGPYKIERGQTTIMNSATGLVPTEGMHIRQSEVCATCHTLYTTPLGAGGQAIGRLPEQVPFLEWQRSEFAETKSCQDCHMPVVQERARIASVLGEERDDMRRHSFRGGNFFVLSMLSRYRDEMDVAALPEELERQVTGTIDMLRHDSARVAIERASLSADTLTVDVAVENLGGHKLPTAYPSRRVWLHFTVRDAADRVVFESGRVAPDGSIQGADHDRDASLFEPHYSEITDPGQVQIYESVLVDRTGAVTTALLSAVEYAKDNRLLPKGFEKAGAAADIAVRGGAVTDSDFSAGGDRVRYGVNVAGAQRPFRVAVDVLYQPISYRWAQTFSSYQAAEPQRFLRYYNAQAATSSATLAEADLVVP